MKNMTNALNFFIFRAFVFRAFVWWRNTRLLCRFFTFVRGRYLPIDFTFLFLFYCKMLSVFLTFLRTFNVIIYVFFVSFLISPNVGDGEPFLFEVGFSFCLPYAYIIHTVINKSILYLNIFKYFQFNIQLFSQDSFSKAKSFF